MSDHFYEHDEPDYDLERLRQKERQIDTLRYVRVPLEYHNHTDSILMGYVVAHFDAGDIKGHIVGSGKTLRVNVSGVDGYVDIDIRGAINRAVEMMTRDRATE